MNQRSVISKFLIKLFSEALYREVLWKDEVMWRFFLNVVSKLMWSFLKNLDELAFTLK